MSNIDKGVSVLIWLSGLLTTYLFFNQLGMGIFGLPVAFVAQVALTRLQSPIWNVNFKNQMAVIISLSALIIDVMFNSSGIFLYVVNFNNTDLGRMLTANGLPVVKGIGFLIICMIIGLFQAAAPEILWCNLLTKKGR